MEGGVMATTTFDNVVSFPDGGRFPATPGGRILNESRDLVARRLREALRPLLEKIVADLIQRGDLADGRDRRTFLYDLKDAVNGAAVRFEGQLAAQWAREFEAALTFKPTDTGQIRLEDLQLVEDGEYDEELAVKSLARRIEEKCEDDLYAVGRRLGALSGKENPRPEENPAAPRVFARAWQAGLRELGFDTASRLELSNCAESHVAELLAPIYHELNSSLVRHNILPGLRRGYSRVGGHVPKHEGADIPGGDVFALLQRLVAGPAAQTVAAAPGGYGMPGAATAMSPGAGQAMPPGSPGGALGGGVAGPAFPLERVWASLDNLQRSLPAGLFTAQPNAPAQAQMPVNTNVLREFRSSDVGQGLGQLDAITVDIVAMLFDMIFDDREIADPIKALVGKLQIPVLKVAMLDKSFFSSKAHPARHLLDVISRAALRWGREVRHDDPIYRKIAEVIDRLHLEFKQDTALFETVCTDLETFLAEQEDLADAQAARAAPLVVQREQEEMAALTAEQMLRPWLDSPLPQVVVDLLHNEWRALLVSLRKQGGSGEAWDAAVRTARDLVASVQPKLDVQERQSLARQLPLLVKQLTNGFDRLGVGGDRRHALFDALFAIHAAVLRGTEAAAPEVEQAPAAISTVVEPAIASNQLDDGEITVDSISLNAPVTSEAAGYSIEGLQRGDWVEFAQGDGKELRYRLSWISPQRGIYLFTNPSSPRALAVSPEALTLQIERGEASIVPIEPIFDRAVVRALDALKAA
jgi:hypothetical protein